jgi:5-methyltetrahydropteroyltriglutamate--homocysteine methyltransferase
MSIRLTPPVRADHVGSLLRPPELMQARDDFAAGRIDREALTAIEDSAITDVVKLQEEIGLMAATDGEFRRSSWHMDFIYQLGGIREDEEHQHVTFHNAQGDVEFNPARARVYDTVTLPRTIFGDHFTYLKSQVTTATPKLTIPSPSMVHYRSGRPFIDTATYPEMDGFWDDVSAAYAQEVQQLFDLGCSYLQMDDTCFAYLNDEKQRAEIAERGEDGENLHLRYIRQINKAVENRPEGMTLTVHMCRGNFRSSWVAEGGYDHVAEPLLSELDVDGYFMEFDDDRSGGFEPLRFLAPGKIIVLGLVTSKRPELESKDEIKRRLEAASKYVPMEQLALSPQCGFSSTAEGNSLTIEEEKAKLRLVVEVAEEVWGR